MQAPKTSRIVLNFDEFDIATDADDDCIDKVTLRFDRLGQPGDVYVR